MVLRSTAKCPGYNGYKGSDTSPYRAIRDLFCLEVWFGLFLEHFDINHFWAVTERGVFMNSRKKGRSVPRWTPRPGPGTGMPRCGSRGKRRRQTPSPILYETGEVVTVYIVMAYIFMAYIVMMPIQLWPI